MQLSSAGQLPTQPLRRAATAVLALSQRLPWAGWIGWLIFVAVALVRTNPHRFGSTFGVYLDTAEAFWAHQPLYTDGLGGFLYWPVSVLFLSPFLLLPPTAAAVLAQALWAGLVSWGSVALMRALMRDEAKLADPIVAAGYLLLINIPAAWFNFKGVQSAIPMLGAMMLASAAMMRGRWRLAALWLFVAAVFKPLAIVMMLLCGAVERRLRVPLACAVTAALLLPFLFADSAYVASTYRAWAVKMWEIGAVLPGEWIYQADFTTMLLPFGIVVPRTLGTLIRALAALGTLGLALSTLRSGSKRATGFAILLLSVCYVTLFGPRNEYLSFLLVTFPLAGLSVLMLMRNAEDYRPWLLIGAALVLGFDLGWDQHINSVVKPAIVLAIFIWLARLMLVPERWRRLVDG